MVSNRLDFNSLFYAEPRFLMQEDGIRHGFFGRAGGVSAGTYASLNCGPGSSDDPQAVAANRQIVAEAMQVPARNLLSPYQTHSADCIEVDEPWEAGERPRADALVTRVPGLALGILTADCAPVLFYGESVAGPVIGAAHAGWRGALGGILEATVGRMAQAGAARESLHACIGPCIGRRSYEVDRKFRDTFITQNAQSEQFFMEARKEGHFLFDLAAYCAARLAGAGVHDITLMDRDTYAEEDAFFSHRRSTHRGEADCGRQISVIAIL